MIKSILVMLCDLSGWWFLKIVQPSLLASSSCHLKRRPAMFWTEALATDPFSSIFMKYDCSIEFEEAFIRNAYNQKDIFYHLWNLREGHHL